MNNSIFAHYVSEYPSPSSGITLFEDSTYKCYFGACLVSAYDSGKFEMTKDTIYLTSLIENRVDTNNKYHGQVWPQTGKRFLLRNGRIYHDYKNGIYDKKIFWLHENRETLPIEVLDSPGNGYARLYNGHKNTTQSGIFKNYKLYDGNVFIYSGEDKLKMIQIFKKGLKINDSIL